MTHDGVVLEFGKRSDRIERAHLDKIFRSERHPYQLEGYCTTEQKGTFTRVSIRSSVDFAQVFETRLLSYATEERFDVVCISFADTVICVVQAESLTYPGFDDALREFGAGESLVACEFTGSARGIAERACGKWVIESRVAGASQANGNKICYLTRFQLKESKSSKKTVRTLDLVVRKNARKSISVLFPWKLVEVPENPSFVLFLLGVEKGVCDVDLRDLFVSSKVQCSVKTDFGQQRIVFMHTPNSPLLFHGQMHTSETGSWDRPLLKECIPEGARILSVLASGRRKEHIVRLPSFEGKGQKSNEVEGEARLLDLHLDPKQTSIAKRWKRFNTESSVYVDTNSIPASCMSAHATDIMYCCCANTLDVRGGGLKAEGLTLLPPGRLFLMLCHLAFGLFKQENVDDGSIVQKVIRFVDNESSEVEKEVMKTRILTAVTFHFTASQLDSKLECFPWIVEQLLSVFQGVDGFDCPVWTELDSNPFVGKNLEHHRTSHVPILTKAKENKIKRNPEKNKKSNDPLPFIVNGRNNEVGPANCKEVKKMRPDASELSTIKQTGASGLLLNTQFSRISSFKDNECKTDERLFASSPPAGEELTENDLPSSNIMAIIIHEVRSTLGSKCSSGAMSLNDVDWEIYRTTLDGLIWFIAFFVATDIPYIQRNSKASAWLKQTDTTKVRPTASSAALNCVPPVFASEVKFKLVVLDNAKELLVFESLDLAVRMEAAFWLERQFLQGKRHWYQQPDISSMTDRLKSECRLHMKSMKGSDQKTAQKYEKIKNKG